MAQSGESRSSGLCWRFLSLSPFRRIADSPTAFHWARPLPSFMASDGLLVSLIRGNRLWGLNSPSPFGTPGGGHEWPRHKTREMAAARQRALQCPDSREI
jgi:hypothetical protein